MISACSVIPGSTATWVPTPPRAAFIVLPEADLAEELVLVSLGLLDTGYRFGGSNPDAGLDCSGMVSYVVEQVSGQRLPHNAAEIAARTRPVDRAAIRPGDLVFFNTQNRPYSHMGIYLGDDRFIHAPSSRGKVRLERLGSPYFRDRFDGARSLQPLG
ncbi:MAG: C40 family peptidase [Zoogloeaceae bacterium]|nr:C40 family peptidase [Zoogloeaceae bacterium]